MIGSRLTLWIFGALGGFGLLLAAWLGFQSWKSGIEDAAFADGQAAERAVWNELSASNDIRVAEVLSDLAKSEARFHRVVGETRETARLAIAQVQEKLSQQSAVIARLQGEIDATPILETAAARERVDPVRLRQHARADADLAQNRRNHPDAAGPTAPDPAAGGAVPVGEPALVATAGLTLGGAERRAAHLAAALVATENRYLALWDFVTTTYESDLRAWQAEQVRIAEVDARVADSAADPPR
ncbi:hypothetical protein [Litorimonas sp. WD9-15]|uniref:hypothetical protein n=1 Tax=Litorimonas sp. WD9-15 TaxID=3418716 RepID=UPI003CFD4C94